MMKTMLLLLAPLMSMSAMAATTVTKISSNGTVAPQYQQTKTCSIESTVTSIRTTGGVAPLNIQKETTFDDDIRNQYVVGSLASSASNARVETNPGPIGGATVTYMINTARGQFILRQTSGEVVVKENTSAPAKRLVKFLDKNCD